MTAPVPAIVSALPSGENGAVLDREIAWLGAVVNAAIRIYLGSECEYGDIHEIGPPELGSLRSPYVRMVRECELTFGERVIFALALAPHLRPQALDPFLIKNPNLDRGFTEFGGIRAGQHSGFVPTVETALFVLAGNDLGRRLQAQRLLEPDGVLRARKLIRTEEVHNAPPFSSALDVPPELLAPLTTGSAFRPAFSESFPARRLTTPQEWSDLVLAGHTMDEIEEIRAWIEHREALLHEWHLARKIKPGFRSLFYGPPGTGKTFTVSLLGRVTGLDVYRVDLSLIVSKWVGETEKNLSSVFDRAAEHDWILFFDEADALFGKRTQTQSANDRYANQEVAYLLQRIEDFPGIVILASNLKGNIDEAFARRFQSMVFFPMPSPAERLRLWRGAFAPERLEPDIDFEKLAQEFELSGGEIVNVLRFASLMALRGGAERVSSRNIRQGISREFRKSGRAL